ncbi:MAG: ferrous iron transport protein B [Chrysiogenetes bacterium]|nr:ferrous iron transport protein B [Chrysiogenetes bacterium]
MSQEAEKLPSPASPAQPARRVVALAGNPNVGKTALFNQLTGLRQKVGNYPGVTVERKVGQMLAPGGSDPVDIIDVPGTYSLNPKSLDEEIAYRVLIGEMEGTPAPQAVVCVLDASNLERNLYLASQIMDLGIPTLVALNMIDAAEKDGITIDADALSKELGVPVFPIVASRGKGIEALKEVIAAPFPACPLRHWKLQPEVEAKVAELEERIEKDIPHLSHAERFVDAVRALTTRRSSSFEAHHNLPFWEAVDTARAELESNGIEYESAEIVGRYEWLTPLAARVTSRRDMGGQRTLTERLDAVLTHKIAGPALFLLILMLIFQSVFAWAEPFMNFIDDATVWAGSFIAATLPAGPIRDLLVDGVVAGVGAVVIFLPQILILFFFLGMLEDTGYMARAAFIMDRVMKNVGLSGRSVVPLLSSFACAIPGVMAARTIENQRDRLITILVAPLMTCSARLPVYTLMIAAFIPKGEFGFIGYQGLTLFLLYLAGIVMAVIASWALKKWVVKGEQGMFLMELPPYRMPRLRDVILRMSERAKLFLTRAGTVILSLSVVLWFLASFPVTEPPAAQTARAAQIEAQLENDLPEARRASLEEELVSIEDAAASAQLRGSVIGRMGQAIEPLIRPLGYDWKIGIALITSFAAREVLVSTLGTIYSVGDADEESSSLKERMIADTYPDGTPVWTPMVAVSVMVFFVFALQCMSTVAIVRRETGTWKWPVFMLAYMGILAYVASFVVYHGGKAMGFN